MADAIKTKLRGEYAIFREEVTWVEYALWWVGRLMLLYALVTAVTEQRGESLIMQLRVEFALMFFLPILHILPRRIFLARLSYRVQDIVVVMLLTTAFFGQFRGFYSTVEWFDAIMHVIGCFVCVYAGYELTMALRREKTPLSPVVAAMCGFGFSFFFAVGWEIFEFICDNIFEGSNSQNWSNINSEGLLAFFPGMEPQRLPLLDTMTDLIAGSVGSLFGGVFVFVYVYVRNKKAALILVENKARNRWYKAPKNTRRESKKDRRVS